jgi:Winged helix-turn helix
VPEAAGRATAPPRAGADPAPRWTLKRLVLSVHERFGRVVCRETIRSALHRLGLSWKQAKKLLGRADPERRQAFVKQLEGLLEGAPHDQHLLVYLAEAPIHQNTGLGRGWSALVDGFTLARALGQDFVLRALSLQRRSHGRDW